jgi:hypothetical protein
MDLVLGVSVSATTVHMLLIEGEVADGVTIESEILETAASDGAVRASTSEQISAAILATQQRALSIGHHLVVSGVTGIDEPAPAPLSDSIAARDLHNVVLVAEHNAAGMLAQTVGRALGYDTVAMMLTKSDMSTLSIVDSVTGSIVEVHNRTLGGADLTTVLPEMVTTIEARTPHPGCLVALCSASDVRSVKSSLERLLSLPVIVPEEPGIALARGAALAAANACDSENSTSALAYSQDPDWPAAVDCAPVKLSDANTQAAVIEYDAAGDAVETAESRAGRRRFIPVPSVVAAAVVIGAVTAVMWIAASVEPTAHPDSALTENAAAPGAVESALAAPSVVAQQAPPVVAQQAPPQQPPPIPASSPAPSAAPPPPPPTAESVVVQAQASAPPIRPVAPSRAVADPVPIAVQKPIPAPVVAVEPAPAASPVPESAASPPAPLLPVPMPSPPIASPAPVVAPPPSIPAVSPAVPRRQAMPPQWTPPSLWIGLPAPQQQVAQAPQERQWLQIPLGPQPPQQGPQPQVTQPPQQVSPGVQIPPGIQIGLGPWQQSPRLSQSLPPPASPLIPQWAPNPAPPQLQESPPTLRSPYQVPSRTGNPGSEIVWPDQGTRQLPPWLPYQ